MQLIYRKNPFELTNCLNIFLKIEVMLPRETMWTIKTKQGRHVKHVVIEESSQG